MIAHLAVRLHRLRDDAIKTWIGAELRAGEAPDATWDFTGEHLVEHHADGIQVSAAIERNAGNQGLGGHEIGRAHRHVRLRQAALACIALFGQSEVRHLHRTLHVDEDVGRFDVAVDDAVEMRVVQRVADVSGDGKRVILRQFALGGDHLGHIGAINELHDDVEQAGLRFAEVEHIHDARVVHLRHRACFIFEAFGKLGVLIVH